MNSFHFDRRRFLQGSLGVSLAAAGSSFSLLQAEQTRRFDAPENEEITRARQAALDVLQPTEKQLQHGLELHANSLVFDAYGFSPRAALDGDAVRRQIEAGASDIELEDLREEMSMTRMVASDIEKAEYLQAWRASGVTCIFQNAGEEGQDPLRMLKRLGRFTYVTDMLPDQVAKAATPDDIEKAKKQGQHCLYFTTNGVPLTQSWTSVEDELRYVRVFFQLGVRMMHVTYNRRNMLGDGCAEPANGGLSDFGRSAIAEMNRVGIIVDVAHSGWQTSLESARESKAPMVASHTTCDALHHHIRAKPNNVIQAICNTGGLVGICCIPSFLGRSRDIAALLDHIDHVVQHFGVEHVAIGTDVAYSSRNSAAESKKIPGTGPKREAFRSLWPEDAFVGSKRDLSLSWTNWPLFTVGLVQRGYRDEDIQKIIGGNILRVTRQALSASGA